MQRKKKSFKIVEEGVDKMEEDDLMSRRYPVRAYDE